MSYMIFRYLSNQKRKKQLTNILHTKPAPIRVGGAICLKPEMYERYTELHDKVWIEVLERMHSSNIRNFTLYYHEETHTLFSHFEWVGNQSVDIEYNNISDFKSSNDLIEQKFDEDMAAISNDPVVKKWWSECEPCQIPFSHFKLGFDKPPSQSGTADWWAPLKCLCHCGHWPIMYSSEYYDPLWRANNPNGHTCTSQNPKTHEH